MTNTTNTTATINATVATTEARIATPINALGLKEYDLVQTVGKGIGIVLRKKSINDELVIYSLSSASVTHPNDDDGMAKVRRYNADGTIVERNETTGKKLKNRDIYTITGIKSYVNPVLAMKDFINQNTDIEFDPVVVTPVAETTETVADNVPTDTADVTPEIDITEDMSKKEMFAEMLKALNGINNKLDAILNK